jgi:molybdopterin converting factor small subunit
MRIEVVCFGAMRDFLPAGAVGNSAELELPEGATVSSLAALLGAPERLLHSILVNGDRADLAQRLSDGEEVTLMPPFAGG